MNGKGQYLVQVKVTRIAKVIVEADNIDMAEDRALFAYQENFPGLTEECFDDTNTETNILCSAGNVSYQLLPDEWFQDMN